MRRLFLFFFFVMAMCVASFSQKRVKLTPEAIITNLQTSSSDEGKVTITQDPKMQLLLKKQLAEKESDLYVYYSGYRVQVYMSNAQKKAKEEAYEREKKMKDKMSDLTCYVSFTSPFWRLRVGDCRTYTDALVLANKIKETFPEFASDVAVVKDDEARDFEFEQKENWK
ncbi:MAG: SPOR domain-containing protein [Paludibacteraceae bacterium]|nr:SPOR domain-containing protein [Paludibacteraceae bacterium]